MSAGILKYLYTPQTKFVCVYVEWGWGVGVAVYIHCFHIHLMFWFLLRLLLNDLRNLFIFSINVDIDVTERKA